MLKHITRKALIILSGIIRGSITVYLPLRSFKNKVYMMPLLSRFPIKPWNKRAKHILSDNTHTANQMPMPSCLLC